MAILTIERLSKNYGSVKALQEVSFEVPQGTVFGILGPNGSGKTTLLGIIMDVLKPTSGSFRLFDEAPISQHRRRIGTLLETPNFYHYLSAVQNLKITAAIKQKGEEDILHVLQMVDLYQRKDSPFSTYSLGMKQRLAIAAALLGDPEVLVLDEPTNGLDPVGIAEIRELIRKLATAGKTIIMASHMLDEVEKVCTHVAILKFGKLITSGEVAEILVHDDVVEISSSNPGALFTSVQQMSGLKGLQEKDGVIQLFFPFGTARLDEINRFCFEQGHTLCLLQQKKKSLESKFLELTH
jgi:ABC-2 type transport system ATP-binding protein